MNEFSTIKEIMIEFAERFKKERLKQNITQEEMALKTGMSLSTYKTFEKNGKGSFENFISIMKTLGRVVELDALLLQSDFSPKEKVLAKREKKSRQRASSKETINNFLISNTKENKNIKSTKIDSLLEKLKARDEGR